MVGRHVFFLQEQMLIIHGKYENKAISTFSFVHWMSEFFSLAFASKSNLLHLY